MHSFSVHRDVQMLENGEAATNALEVAQSDLDLDFLCLLLGSLNSLSDLHDLPVDLLKVLDSDILHLLVKSLPRLRLSQCSRKQDAGQQRHLFVSLVL